MKNEILFIDVIYIMFNPNSGFSGHQKNKPKKTVKFNEDAEQTWETTRMDLGQEDELEEGEVDEPWEQQRSRGGVEKAKQHVKDDMEMWIRENEEAIKRGEAPPNRLPRHYSSVPYTLEHVKPHKSLFTKPAIRTEDQIQQILAEMEIWGTGINEANYNLDNARSQEELQTAFNEYSFNKDMYDGLKRILESGSDNPIRDVETMRNRVFTYYGKYGGKRKTRRNKKRKTMRNKKRKTRRNK